MRLFGAALPADGVHGYWYTSTVQLHTPITRAAVVPRDRVQVDTRLVSQRGRGWAHSLLIILRIFSMIYRVTFSNVILSPH